MFCTHCGSAHEVTFCHVRWWEGHLRLSLTWDPKQQDGHYPVSLCAKCAAKDYVLLQYVKEPVEPDGDAGKRGTPPEQPPQSSHFEADSR